ncbi:MAG: hypothetical protein HYV13_01045 [Candidatus Doudnabacteria bacterium]|nr:hypothetical protein [Candidatus Doudnabacteria bacterium]
MKQRLAMSQNQQQRPVLALDCELDIEPRPGTRRTLKLDEMDSQGALRPVIIMESPHSIRTIRFDEGFDPTEFFKEDRGQSLAGFYEKAGVWFEREDLEEGLVHVIVHHGRQFVDQLVTKKQLAPFFKFFICEDDEPDADEILLEESFA